MSPRRRDPWRGLLLAAALLAGCLAQEDKGVGRRFEGEAQPRCYERARFLEERALRSIRDANDPRYSLRRQKELFDHALDDLREARDLYTEELADDPGPPERREVLELECERLNDTIERTHDERPPG